MISIIIPVFNQTDKIGACLDSILGQSVIASQEKLEVVAVNDGSKDDIIPVIEKYKPLFQAAGIKFNFITQENRGANAARNTGARLAQGEYIIFCDADIVMKEKMLGVMSETLKKNLKASFTYSSFLWGRKLFKSFPYSAEKLKVMPYIHTTSLIRREYFSGFDEKIKRFQDWDLWLTMSEQGHVGVWINEILFTVATGGKISYWLPGFAYKLLPFLPAVKEYKLAMGIIKDKHNLNVYKY